MRADAIYQGFTYNPETGAVYKDGKLCTVKDSAGYMIAKYEGRYHPQHRIAWYLMTGQFPKVELDHINRNKSDNRWCNLREATRQQNCQNRGPHRNNTLKVRGVRYRADGFYEPRLMKSGKAIYLGIYRTLDEAVKVRRQAEQMEFTHAL